MLWRFKTRSGKSFEGVSVTMTEDLERSRTSTDEDCILSKYCGRDSS